MGRNKLHYWVAPREPLASYAVGLKLAVQFLLVITRARNNKQHAKLFGGSCSERAETRTKVCSMPDLYQVIPANYEVDDRLSISHFVASSASGKRCLIDPHLPLRWREAFVKL
jgi:hypothetical protein